MRTTLSSLIAAILVSVSTVQAEEISLSTLQKLQTAREIMSVGSRVAGRQQHVLRSLSATVQILASIPADDRPQGLFDTLEDLGRHFDTILRLAEGDPRFSAIRMQTEMTKAITRLLEYTNSYPEQVRVKNLPGAFELAYNKLAADGSETWNDEGVMAIADMLEDLGERTRGVVRRGIYAEPSEAVDVLRALTRRSEAVARAHASGNSALTRWAFSQ